MDTRETWSFFQKLQETFRTNKSFVKSRHWLTSPQGVQYRKYILSQATIAVKVFRRQIKRGELSLEEINQRKASVYGRYAQAINEIEIWTGQSRRMSIEQDFNHKTDYRLSNAGRVRKKGFTK